MAWHTRSAPAKLASWSAAIGAVLVYWPSGQLALCVAQSRSDDAVAATVSNSSLSHTSVVSQAAVLTPLENVWPATHGAHSRSDVLVGALDWPSPSGHVFNLWQVRSEVAEPSLP